MRLIFVLYCLLTSISIFSQSKPEITSFTPQGLVKQIKQVKASFSESMISFGNPRLKTDQFEVKCPVPGKGRWLDDKNFVYEFDKQLDSGIECSFQLKEEVKTSSGKAIVGKKLFSFNTGGPAAISVSPWAGSEIEEDQIFIVRTDGPVDESSLSNVHFKIDGNRSKVESVLASLEEIKAIQKSLGQQNDPEFHYYIKSKLKFPNSRKVALVWDKGIKSKNSKIATTELQNFEFMTRKEFTIDYSCERENQNSECIPLSNISLNFSSGVSRDLAGKIVLKTKNKSFSAKITEEGNIVYGLNFEPSFLENTTFQIEVPNDLVDDSGRKLGNPRKFPLTVKTGAFPPLAKFFNGRFGILEHEKETLVPLTIRNLEKGIKSKIYGFTQSSDQFSKFLGKQQKIDPKEILNWLDIVQRQGRDKSLFDSKSNPTSFAIPQSKDGKAFEVVGIPLKETGFYILEIQSFALGKSLLDSSNPMYVPTSVLVTNMAVHFKKGRENSLVWVTTLKTSEPVKDAKITIYDCNKSVLFNGTTNGNGVAIINKELHPANCTYKSEYSTGMLVVAEKEKDLSFVHSSWEGGIESWRYNLPGEYNQHAPKIVHTILDRTLFRAGDTVNMKHFLRRHSIPGFQFLSAQELPSKAVITHQGSAQEYSFALKWNKNSTSETTWKLPKEAKLGYYQVSLVSANKATVFHSSMFRVEEFRLPLLKAVIKSPSEKLVQKDSFPVDFMVSYLSGGGASGLPVSYHTWNTENTFYGVKDYEDYSFAETELKEGRINHSDSQEGEENSISEVNANKSAETKKTELTLDSNGGSRAVVSGIPKKTSIQTAHVELEYRDPNGEIQTVSSSTRIFPADLVVGLKQDGWISSEKIKLSSVVLSLDNKPVEGKNVVVKVFERKYFSNRKRLVGGFYGYENFTEIKQLSTFCSGKTNSRGEFQCEGKSPITGNIILQASVEDSSGRLTFSKKDVYVPGSEENWSEASNHDRIDLLPEKKFYEPGETAKLQARLPFKSSKALVTIEREGILDYYIKQIDGQDPIIDVPIKENYGPNIFVSLLAVRGRVSDPKPTATIDLGKPSFKLGIVPLRIGWKNHELKVAVSTEKEVFKVRENVRARVKVQTNNNQPLKEGEVTIAVVDEALLELWENDTWDLLSAMMKMRNLEVTTQTAQMQVIGRRHFGLKALPQGGGGGKEPTRELFDTLLFWKSSIPLNSDGEAEFDFKLNDSLTSFRIVAISNSGAGLFGTGKTSIRSTQNLMLVSGIPPLVREGDSFSADVTARNTTSKPMDVELSLSIKDSSIKFETKKLTLAQGESKEVSWDMKVPYNIEKLVYEISAKSKEDSDKLKITQVVKEPYPVSVLQATLNQLSKEYSMPIETPEGASPNLGGVSVTYSKSLSGNLNSLREYMRKYPYTCMEQQVSRAISLRDTNLWSQSMSKIPAYLDSEGLLKYFPNMIHGSVALTAYVLSISKEAGYELPEDSKNRMINALVNFVDGKLFESRVLDTPDLAVRKLLSIEAITKYRDFNYSNLTAIQFQMNLLPTSALLDYWNILDRVKGISPKEQAEKTKAVETIIRSRANMQGTTMKFSTDKTDNLYWLMTSSDTNAVRLLSTLVTKKKWTEDIGRIVRGVFSKQRKGSWDLTTSNAWGVIALEKFSNEFEKEPITGLTEASMSGEKKTHDWNKSERTWEEIFPWEKGKQELKIKHTGSGKPWVTVQSKAALPIKEAIKNGFSIEKKVTAIEQKNSSGYTRGDVLRIQLKIKSDADMTWVVVNDPIPSGATILSGGLRKSKVTETEKSSMDVYPTFEERSFDAYRVYYEYVPESEWTIEYTIRLNQDGVFQLPQTRVEAMYSPDMNGEFPNKTYTIGR
ncbi:MAG: MG2 domain-containing protein [Leptospiraceae bacterium]|nr:MG2 domain-containing protein [Leptospiraceae bacterium]